METGAEVTVVSESTLQTLGQLEVCMTDKKLCGSNGVPLDLRGSLTVTLSQKQHKCDQEIFVNLLGLPAINGFHLSLVLDNLECNPTIAIKQVYLQGREYSKVIMRSRSSQMLSLSHLALLQTSHYLFMIRWNKNWIWWKLKELYLRYNSLLPGALAWWLWRRRTEEWEFASIWSHSIDAYLANTTLCQKSMTSLDNWQEPLCSPS